MAETVLRFEGASSSNFSDGSICWPFLHEIARTISQGRSIDRVDLSAATHLKPYVVALIVAACRRLNERPPEIVWPADSKVREHLDRLGFTETLGAGGGGTSPPRSTNVPLRVMKSRLDPGFSYRISELLIGELRRSPPPGATCRISNSIDEMISNALAHSRSPIGCVVVGQAFPTTDHVEVVVLDLGITIRQHLNQKYPELTDDQTAIRKAVEYGVTGTIGLNGLGEPNSGAGLADLREYAETSGSEFAVLSGDALATFGPQPREYPLYGCRFPGTLINIRFESTAAY